MGATYKIFASILFAYLIGSIPTGVWITQKMTGGDIRRMGDGNTGARNVTHVLGWKKGFFVALVDFIKGALAILFAKKMSLGIEWQIAGGVSAVVGHDFPLFAKFKGGQGMATSLGTMSVFFTHETITGLIFFGLLYLITHHFEISAAVGLGGLVYLLWKSSNPDLFLVYAVSLFVAIPVKKYWDAKHRLLENSTINKYRVV